MRHWRAFLVAAAIGAFVMGIQPVVFGEPGFAPAMAGIGALAGFCLLLFALGSEGLLFEAPQRGTPKYPPPRTRLVPLRPPPPDAVAGGYIGDLPDVPPEWVPPPEDE
jgi:hypothetical protein